MSEDRFPYNIPVSERRHRNTEQIGEPSQPTPIRQPDTDWLEQDARETMRSLMEGMRDSVGDTLGGTERLHALSDALTAVNIVRCTSSENPEIEFESEMQLGDKE